MGKGWIKLHRSIMDSAVYSDNLRFKAWVDLLLRANHDDKEWFDHGSLVQVKKGQCITSTRQLGKAWGCDKKTVDYILKQFAALGMIERKSPPGKYTLITIVKYGFYQGKGHNHRDSDGDSEWDSDSYTDRDTDGDGDGDTDWTQTRITRTIKNDIRMNKEDKKPASRIGFYDTELED